MIQYKVTVTPAVGTTPASAVVEERTFFQAIGDTLKAKISDDTASVGYASSLTDVGLVYGGMLASKYIVTGGFSWKPF